MKNRKQEFKVTQVFLYYNAEGTLINKAFATSNETIQCAIPYANFDDDVRCVKLVELSTNKVVDKYFKIIN